MDGVGSDFFLQTMVEDRMGLAAAACFYRQEAWMRGPESDGIVPESDYAFGAGLSAESDTRVGNGVYGHYSPNPYSKKKKDEKIIGKEKTRPSTVSDFINWGIPAEYYEEDSILTLPECYYETDPELEELLKEY